MVVARTEKGGEETRVSGSETISEGMQVYTADEQPLGTVEAHQSDGFLVGGQFVPGTAVGRIEFGRIYLTDSGAWFRPQGAERGDQAADDLGPLAGNDPAGPNVSSVPKH